MTTAQVMILSEALLAVLRSDKRARFRLFLSHHPAESNQSKNQSQSPPDAAETAPAHASAAAEAHPTPGIAACSDTPVSAQ